MKKIVLFIALLVVACFTSALACNDFSAISFTSDGEKIYELSPGKTVTASVRISESASGGSYTLMLLNLKENRIIGISADVFDSENDNLTLSASVTLPENIEGNQLVAMLWDGVNTIKPLSSSALMPGYTPGLKYLKAGDMFIEGFSENLFSYSLNIPGNINEPMPITAPAFDGATEVVVRTTERFPGKTVVDIISPKGDMRSYTLVYECDASLCGELKYIGPSESDSYTDGSVIAYNLQNGAKAYSGDSEITIENIPEAIKGSSYIIHEIPMESQSPYIKEKWKGEDTPWYSFTLERAAKVIIFSENEITKFNEQSSWKKEEKLSVEKLDKKNASYKALGYAYSSKFETNGENITVTVPNPSVDTNDYLIVIQYIYGKTDYPLLEEPDYVSALRYGGPVSGGGEYYFDQPQYFKDFKDGSYLLNNYSEIVAKDVASELQGLDHIMMASPIAGTIPTFVKNSWGSGNYNWISFKLHKTAEIKIVVNSGNINSLKNAGFTEIKADGVWLNLHNTTWNSDTPWDTLYSRIYEVTDEPVTVNIPNPNGQGNRWGYIILINYTE